MSKLHRLEAVGRVSETQLQVGENLNDQIVNIPNVSSST